MALSMSPTASTTSKQEAFFNAPHHSGPPGIDLGYLSGQRPVLRLKAKGLYHIYSPRLPKAKRLYHIY